MADPKVMIVFCEDVRNEVGGRISLMGLLGPHLNLDEDRAVMKSIVIGALVRFTDANVRKGQMRIEFLHDDPAVVVPEAPPQEALTFEPPLGETNWQLQVFGSFIGLEVSQGMTIRCTVTLDGQSHSDELYIRRPQSMLNS